MSIKPQVTVSNKGSVSSLALSGSWRIKHIDNITVALEDIDLGQAKKLEIDASGMSLLDTAGAMELYHCLARAGFLGSMEDISFKNFNPSQLALLELVRERFGKPVQIKSRKPYNILERTGRASMRIVSKGYELLSFIGYCVKEQLGIFKNSKLFRKKEFFVQLEHGFLDAIPVVILVNLLIGVVLAYLFAVHTEQYGANIFVVDSLAFAICREFSPLIVAIIVAGRSGSAYTAQIGTMKLNEEVDALQTLGLSPMHVLVLPRIFALMLAMPLLVFVGDVVGIIGGMLIADLRLGITGVTFIERLQVVLTTSSFFVGLIKAPVFAAFIAVIGCRMGLTVENNARSVGLNTTSTVVQSIVAVILLNAAFAVIFTELGI